MISDVGSKEVAVTSVEDVRLPDKDRAFGEWKVTLPKRPTLKWSMSVLQSTWKAETPEELAKGLGYGNGPQSIVDVFNLVEKLQEFRDGVGVSLGIKKTPPYNRNMENLNLMICLIQRLIPEAEKFWNKIYMDRDQAWEELRRRRELMPDLVFRVDQ